MGSFRHALERAARQPRPPFWLQPTISAIALGNKIRTPFFNLRGKRKLAELKNSGSLKLHLGCGRKARYFPHFLNCDMTPYKSVDLVTDCGTLSYFEDRSVDLIYSHAFFEHLFLRQQPVFATESRRVLKENGVLLTLGLPDFEVIAASYLEGRDVLPGQKFDLHWAYWLTHGYPEGDPLCWIGQLHKCLLDRSRLMEMHQKAGFKEVRLFNYIYKDDLQPVNLGVVASPNYLKESSWDLIKEMAPFFSRKPGPDMLLNETVWRL